RRDFLSRQCMHVSVMLPEALEYLAIKPDGVYIDVTAGLGGHTGAIAARGGKVLSLDRDAESMEMARQNVGQLAERIQFRHARVSELASAAAEAGGNARGGLWA